MITRMIFVWTSLFWRCLPYGRIVCSLCVDAAKRNHKTVNHFSLDQKKNIFCSLSSVEFSVSIVFWTVLFDCVTNTFGSDYLPERKESWSFTFFNAITEQKKHNKIISNCRFYLMPLFGNFTTAKKSCQTNEIIKAFETMFLRISLRKSV